MEHLTEEVNLLIKKIVMEDPRLTKEKEEIGPWMQLSQPFLEEESCCSSDEETAEKEMKEIGTQTEKSIDFFPTKKSIAKRKKVRHTATRIKYSPTRVKSRNFLSNIGYKALIKLNFIMKTLY